MPEGSDIMYSRMRYAVFDQGVGGMALSLALSLAPSLSVVSRGRDRAAGGHGHHLAHLTGLLSVWLTDWLTVCLADWLTTGLLTG